MRPACRMIGRARLFSDLCRPHEVNVTMPSHSMTLARLPDTIAQHVFRLPARIQLASPLGEAVRRAAKRKTLYVIQECAGSDRTGRRRPRLWRKS